MDLSGTHHIALVTPDLARLRAFYVETLGLPLAGGFAGHDIVFIGIGETAIELIQGSGARPRTAETGWAHLALEVPDVVAAHDALTAQGIAFHVAPMDFPPEAPAVRIAFFRDPDGNEIELVQRRGERRYPPLREPAGSAAVPADCAPACHDPGPLRVS